MTNSHVLCSSSFDFVYLCGKLSKVKESIQRKKEQNKLLKKMHIINCAENIMLRDGFHKLNMDAVAKEAKIAKNLKIVPKK